MTARVAVVVSGFPRRSETFMLGELLALASRDQLAAVFATKAGETGSLQPGVSDLAKYVQFLPEGSIADQARAIRRALRHTPVNGIHGYFAHRPAGVAQEAAHMLRLPFGFSVHARDLRKITPEMLAARAQAAACVVTCNTDVAHDLTSMGWRSHLMPHGVNLQRFVATTREPHGPLRLLAVGRLVEKKGFHFLLAALAGLRIPFTLSIVGDGPERDRLRHLIASNQLESRVFLRGSRTHSELPRIYAESDVVVVPSVRDRSGDRDGLPNVILEAMACSRAIVAADTGAIASAVTHNETGLLVPASDPVALANAIKRLAENTELRARLERNGRQLVAREYDVERCSMRFQKLLSSAYA